MNDYESIWDKLKKIDKKIVLYGMGNGADLILNELERLEIPVYGVFASDDFVRGQSFRGFSVKKYSDFVSQLGEFIVLVAFGTSRDEVIDNIIRINGEQELYAVDVPVYGDDIFNFNFVKKNIDSIISIYNRLFDDKSKYIYENIILFKYTGLLQFLFNAESDKKEKYEILSLADNEIYADLGAYNGDTVVEFCENVKGYEKIVAVEPDGKTFKKLVLNTENIRNIQRLNCVISDCDGEVEFSASAGRNSSRGNGKLVKAMSVDSIFENESVTFIKADVEGMESEMIKGAENTIKNCKPKMDIACYHRTDDIFEIPLKILKIRSDYNVYIRHFKYVPAWDTDYFFC